MFDLKKIKSIPCQNIANNFDIKLEKKHNRLWGKLRNEKESSFSINLENNLWYDFGIGKGGSVIDLLMQLKGISSNEAIKQLADEFGVKEEKTTGWQPLTDNQYKELGLQPEKATMNFKIDLTKHDIKKVERWSKKYGIPLKELAIKYPQIYNDMVSKIALEKINKSRNMYKLRLEMYRDSKVDKITKRFLKTMAQDNAITINKSIDLLQRGLTIDSNYSYLKVYPEEDFIIENTSYSVNRDIDKMISIYKNKYNYQHIDKFTEKQQTALYEVNNTIYNDGISVLSLIAIKEMYKIVGQRLEKTNNDSIDYQSVKKLFQNLETTVEAIKQVEIKELSKTERHMNLSKNIELSR